jgi:tetratricopeptide (TPR) repeat protein
MDTSRGVLLSGLLSSLISYGSAQPPTVVNPSPEIQFEMENPTQLPLLVDLTFPDERSEDKKDPAYKIYKEGYDAILDERWDDAMKKFSNIVAGYKNSEYTDDAEYWSAYALSHIDRKKSVAAYKQFIKKYPKSRYVDDAVADLGNMNPVVVVSASGDSAHVVLAPRADGYAYGVGSSMAIAETQLRKSEAMIRRMNRDLTRNYSPRMVLPPRLPVGTPHASSFSFASPRPLMWDVAREEKLDPNTRVRLEALYAIGDTKEDETSFQTLKDVALDRSQNIRLRQGAIEVLSDFKKFDVMPVFLELAKKDTSQEIQDVAIEFIGRSGNDKNKSVDALTSLFNSIPHTRKEKLESVLYTIADIGNDKAVDFLATVAQNNENYELRSDAVYYLGTIGGEKARKALYQILKNK